MLGSWHCPLGCCCIASDSLRHPGPRKGLLGSGRGEGNSWCWSGWCVLCCSAAVEGLLSECCWCSSCAIRASFSNLVLRARFHSLLTVLMGSGGCWQWQKVQLVFPCWKKDVIKKHISADPMEKQCCASRGAAVDAMATPLSCQSCAELHLFTLPVFSQ